MRPADFPDGDAPPCWQCDGENWYCGTCEKPESQCTCGLGEYVPVGCPWCKEAR